MTRKTKPRPKPKPAEHILKAKVKPKRKSKSEPNPWTDPLRGPPTRAFIQQVLHQELQPVQQELAAFVEDVRTMLVRTQNLGGGISRIESDVRELIVHLITEGTPQQLRRQFELKPEYKQQLERDTKPSSTTGVTSPRKPKDELN
jgi:hypothetical protein